VSKRPFYFAAFIFKTTKDVKKKEKRSFETKITVLCPKYLGEYMIPSVSKLMQDKSCVSSGVPRMEILVPIVC
jgi:hypothetical protein